MCSLLAQARDAGVLYEVWHTRASSAMRDVLAKGELQLTTELVIESQDTPTPFSLDDVYRGVAADIYNAQPQLGFYCLWRARAGDPAPTPPLDDCANISATAEAHARMLVDAGFDYVAVDITNWPIAGDPAANNDVVVDWRRKRRLPPLSAKKLENTWPNKLTCIRCC